VPFESSDYPVAGGFYDTKLNNLKAELEDFIAQEAQLKQEPV